MPIGSTRPGPVPATAAQWYFRETKLEFLKKDVLAVAYYSMSSEMVNTGEGKVCVSETFWSFSSSS